MALWQHLKASRQGYPLIVGEPGGASLLAEMAELDDRATQEILRAAEGVNFPEGLLARQRIELEEAAREFDQAYDDAELVGDWPGDVVANPEATVTRDLLSGAWLPEVLVVVLPTQDAAVAIAMLRYGGWNACPPAEDHVAAIRSWRDRFGFEPISLSHDVIEGRVAQRPSGRDQALALAREQYAYCPDIVDQGVTTLSALGATLMISDWWFFWWD